MHIYPSRNVCFAIYIIKPIMYDDLLLCRYIEKQTGMVSRNEPNVTINLERGNIEQRYFYWYFFVLYTMVQQYVLGARWNERKKSLNGLSSAQHQAEDSRSITSDVHHREDLFFQGDHQW